VRKRTLAQHTAGRGAAAVLSGRVRRDVVWGIERSEGGKSSNPAIDSARIANNWFPQPVSFDQRDVTVHQCADAASAHELNTTRIPGQGPVEAAFSSMWARYGHQRQVVLPHFTILSKQSDTARVAK
jgi:hypothetical protein